MYKVIKLISIFLHNKNMSPFMKIHVHWVNLMKNQIKQKFQSFEILKEKGYKAKDSFSWPFGKNIMFNGFKMSNFKCKSHVKEIILSKTSLVVYWNSFWGFSRIFYIFGNKKKYWYTITCACEKSPSSHELS
jgi:hypothetical protein